MYFISAVDLGNFLFQRLTSLATRIGADDTADRLNSGYTAAILVILASLTMFRQFIMRPINCYIANPLSGDNLREYVDNYCWVEGTVPYILNPPNQSVRNPVFHEDLDKWVAQPKLVYYHWIPFLLGIQGILFGVIGTTWTILCDERAGTSLNQLLTFLKDSWKSGDLKKQGESIQFAARTFEMMKEPSTSSRQKQFRQFSEKVSHSSQKKRKFLQAKCIYLPQIQTFWKWFRSSLLIRYFLMKLVCTGNIIGQLWIMAWLLSLDGTQVLNKPEHDLLFGWHMLIRTLRGQDWRQSVAFPRVSFCPVPLRQLHGMSHILAQCVLPANMLFEKICLFLWFWFVVCGFLMFLSIFTWVHRLLWTTRYYRTITRYQTNDLENLRKTTSDSELSSTFSHEKLDYIQEFHRHILTLDKMFLILILQDVIGSVFAENIVKLLWRRYLRHRFICDLGNHLKIHTKSGSADEMDGERRVKGERKLSAILEDDLDAAQLISSKTNM